MFCTAAVFTDEIVEIVFSVVVTQLLAGFDGALGIDEDFIAFYLNFAVWTARVIDVSGDVFSGGTVDGFAVAQFKKILTSNTVRFVFSDDVAPIFNNESASRNRNICKNT